MTLQEIVKRLKVRSGRQARRNLDGDHRVWEVDGDQLRNVHGFRDEDNLLTTGDIGATDWIIIPTHDEEMARLRRDVTKLREKLEQAAFVERELRVEIDGLKRKAAAALKEATRAIASAHDARLEGMRTRVRLGQVAARRRKDDGQCPFHRPKDMNTLTRCWLGEYHDAEPHQDDLGNADGLWMRVSDDIYQGDPETEEATHGEK